MIITMKKGEKETRKAEKEAKKEQFLKNKNVIFVGGNAGKNKISKFLDDYIKSQANPCDYYQKMNENYENFAKNTTSRTRAYLKIQDGCNNFCSYCLIPFVRGRSRSRDLNEIVLEAEQLAKTNKEIVLTGINMSDYKLDGKLALGQVMYALKDIDARIRIGSLEVNVIDDEFLTTLKSMPNFCPQFHLSMQSGCDRILTLMNRHYDKEKYLEKVELIRKYFSDASITTDVIVGFPTETEEDFLETVETIKRAKFFKMHIFPYSLREGTRASKLKQVDGLVKKQRVKILEELDNNLHSEYLRQMKGQTQNVLIDNQQGDYLTGYTENYIKVYFDKTSGVRVGDMIKIKVGDMFEDGIMPQNE